MGARKQMPRTEEASQRIRDERREHLLHSAARVFARKGLAATKIADIAADAGVSHGLVYHYFGSKEDVFRAVVERTLQGAVGVIEEAVNQPGSPLEKLTWYTEQVFDGLRKDSGYAMVALQVLTSEDAPRELYEQLLRVGAAIVRITQRLIHEGQATGEIVAGDATQLAVLFNACIQGISTSAAFVEGWSVEALQVSTVMGILRKEKGLEKEQ
jgi:AcrR family transcriptional regulator